MKRRHGANMCAICLNWNYSQPNIQFTLNYRNNKNNNSNNNHTQHHKTKKGEEKKKKKKKPEEKFPAPNCAIKYQKPLHNNRRQVANKYTKSSWAIYLQNTNSCCVPSTTIKCSFLCKTDCWLPTRTKQKRSPWRAVCISI